MRREILDRFGEEKLYGGGLSVRTTLDPNLQRMARTALIDGFVAYDHRHSGWRGPVKTIDIKGDWGKTLGSMPVWTDIDPWRLAVVLDVAKDKATIGLSPGTHSERRAGQGARYRRHSLRGSEMGTAAGRRAASAERRRRSAPCSSPAT